MVVEKKVVEGHDTIIRVEAAVNKFYQLNERLFKEEKELVKEKILEKWCMLEEGLFIINNDGSLDPKGGAGVVVRNSYGDFVDGIDRCFSTANTSQAEVVALRDGVSLAVEKKLQKVIMEINSKEVLYMLTNNYKMIDWKVRHVAIDIQRMLSDAA